MEKICFCDIDGILADTTEREWQARKFADSRFVPEPGIIPGIVYHDAWQKIFYSKRGFYKPELLALDTLVEGVVDALYVLETAGYDVIYLTSRPTSLFIATHEWLFAHHISGPRLVMKQSAFTQAPPNHKFTRIWKAGMIQTLTALYGASDVLVIDDSEDVRETIKQYGAASAKLRCASSLQEAVSLLESEREG